MSTPAVPTPTVRLVGDTLRTTVGNKSFFVFDGTNINSGSSVTITASSGGFNYTWSGTVTDVITTSTGKLALVKEMTLSSKTTVVGAGPAGPAMAPLAVAQCSIVIDSTSIPGTFSIDLYSS
ncbi:MAG: hypothetical protein K2X82_06945 [Gemmataceae bacterium]|nr:hypothetical protein [Gemmataceae bacterium]